MGGRGQGRGGRAAFAPIWASACHPSGEGGDSGEGVCLSSQCKVAGKLSASPLADPLDTHGEEGEEIAEGDEIDEIEEEDEIEEDEDDDDDEAVAGMAEEWPKLDNCKPRSEHEPLELGPNTPRALGEGSIYPAVATLNANVNQHLREYQREGVKWLWGKYTRGEGGILGDEMGLGKTVQVAAFLSVVLGKTATSADKQRSFPLDAADCRQALVVVPSVTLANWQRELATWGFFRVKKAHGSDKADALRAVLARECEVVLTTYDTLRTHVGDLSRIPWEVTIYDEAHLIKNEKSARHLAVQQIKCKRRFGLTGTPMSNKVIELWVLFNWVSDGRVGDKKHFENHFSKGLLNGLKKTAKQWEIAVRVKRQDELKTLNEKWMLQRFKSIIAHEMPTKKDHIVFCRLAPEQEAVYKHVLTLSDYVGLIKGDEPCDCNSGEPRAKCCPLDPTGPLAKWKHPDNDITPGCCPACIMFPAMQQLQKIANHLSLIYPEPGPAGGTDDAMYQRQADFCRAAFDNATMDVRRDRSFFEQSHATHCGKMQVLRVLLKQWKIAGDKVLLFSYSTQMLDILEDFVTGYSQLRLDGSTSAVKRGQLVKSFNTNPHIFIFLLSTKAGGLGINLTAANKVVVFDPNWNPSWDMQAQDRAYRIGQRKNVEVYRFIASNTIEEKVYQRQLYKQGQEGLALHQRDEFRQFAGVMGDNKQQGELFGIKNLLAFDDAATESNGTRDIVSGRISGFDEADGYRIELARDRAGGSASGEAGGSGDGGDAEDDEAEDGNLFGDESGVRWLVDRLSGGGGSSKAKGKGKATTPQAAGSSGGAGGSSGGSGGTKRARDAGASTSAANHTAAADDDGGVPGLQEELSEIEQQLRQVGAVHTHLTSEVIGGAPIDSLKERAAKIAAAAAVQKAPPSTEATNAAEAAEAAARGGGGGGRGGGGSGGGGSRGGGNGGGGSGGGGSGGGGSGGGSGTAAGEAPAPPRPTAKRAKPTQDGAGLREARGTDVAGASKFRKPANLTDCLCGCKTYSEYMRMLIYEQMEVAWRASYADTIWGKAEELAALVNALPEGSEA
jgi:SNF2 family DNA or RNA helicase